MDELRDRVAQVKSTLMCPTTMCVDCPSIENDPCPMETVNGEQETIRKGAADLLDKLVALLGAAVADLNEAKPCVACKHNGVGCSGSATAHCSTLKSLQFEWRGMQEEAPA